MRQGTPAQSPLTREPQPRHKGVRTEQVLEWLFSSQEQPKTTTSQVSCLFSPHFFSFFLLLIHSFILRGRGKWVLRLKGSVNHPQFTACLSLLVPGRVLSSFIYVFPGCPILDFHFLSTFTPTVILFIWIFFCLCFYKVCIIIAVYQLLLPVHVCTCVSCCITILFTGHCFRSTLALTFTSLCTILASRPREAFTVVSLSNLSHSGDPVAASMGLVCISCWLSTFYLASLKFSYHLWMFSIDLNDFLIFWKLVRSAESQAAHQPCYIRFFILTGSVIHAHQSVKQT